MPTTSWRKQQIIDWLQHNQFKVPDGISSFHKMTVKNLLELSKTKYFPFKCVVEELAENCGKDVVILWLPPAHCELNPIELIWANVKNYAASNNHGGNLDKIDELTNEALER